MVEVTASNFASRISHRVAAGVFGLCVPGPVRDTNKPERERSSLPSLQSARSLPGAARARPRYSLRTTR
jgi:hypothetical protein